MLAQIVKVLPTEWIKPIGATHIQESCQSQVLLLQKSGIDEIYSLSVEFSSGFIFLSLISQTLGNYQIDVTGPFHSQEWGFIASIVERWLEACQSIRDRRSSHFRNEEDWDTLEEEFRMC